VKRAFSIVFISWRYYVVLAAISILVGVLAGRVLYLSLVQRPFLQTQGEARSLRVINIPAFRGMITDRNGYPLAVSAAVSSAWVNPQDFSPTAAQWKLLQRYLVINTHKLAQQLHHEKTKGREFFYLKRGLDPTLAESLKNQKIPGLYFQTEFKRFYPEAEVSAQLLGFTNVDDRGQEGIELAYNDWLQGVPGRKVVLHNRLGEVISDLRLLRDQKPGRPVALSIDRRIQYLAYRELMQGVEKNAAQAGTAIVLDVKTGEVLAMVNYPSFNPNHRADAPKNAFRNRAVTDIFEPGSTIKAFSVASALDSGKFNPNTVIDTFPGWIRVGRNVVHDEKNNGELSLAEVLQKSSDVGTTKMILSLPPEHLWEVLHHVGFGEQTGIEFPGEQAGVLVKRPRWGAFMTATLSFGYGISVTPIQLARAYAVLANDGIKMPITLLRRDQVPAGERVMESAVSKQMLGLLESVVEAKESTGRLARVPGYRVAGKTGTARMLANTGYQKDHHISSFIGLAPVSHPQVVVAVIIYDPQGRSHMGSQVSAPIFSKIMQGSLRVLNVQPDGVEETPNKA